MRLTAKYQGVGQAAEAVRWCGLYLLVKPTGTRLWHLKYRVAGREKLISFGQYPDVSLKQAREQRDEARKLIAAKVDPSAKRKAERAAQSDTFEAITREWLDVKAQAIDQHPGQAPGSLRDIRVPIHRQVCHRDRTRRARPSCRPPGRPRRRCRAQPPGDHGARQDRESHAHDPRLQRTALDGVSPQAPPVDVR